jgi:Inward rectifier potassium channel C-terminal domain
MNQVTNREALDSALSATRNCFRPLKWAATGHQLRTLGFGVVIRPSKGIHLIKVTISRGQVDFELHQLDMGYHTGDDRLCLWLPVVVKHVINDASPLRHWRNPGGRQKDASSTILVEVMPS